MASLITREEAARLYARFGLKPIGGGSGEGGEGGSGGAGAGGSGSGGGQSGGEGGKGKEGGENPPEFKAPASEDELNRMIRDRIARAEKKAREEAEAATEKRIKDDAAAEEAKKQGNFQKLYEAEQQKAADLEERIKELEEQGKSQSLQSVRERIAKKLGLPSELADRLKGDDEAAIEADAKALAKTVAPKPPETEGGKGGAGKGKPAANAGAPVFRPATSIVRFPDRVQAKAE